MLDQVAEVPGAPTTTRAHPFAQTPADHPGPRGNPAGISIPRADPDASPPARTVEGQARFTADTGRTDPNRADPGGFVPNPTATGRADPNAAERVILSDPAAELSGPAGFDAARDTRPSAALITRHGPDLPQHVARQIAESAPGPQQATEVRLNPEELGRVRMTMVQSDGAISVTISAERGETLDLMRRHIGLLSEEFRQIGYGSIQFDFGHDRRGQGAGHPFPGDDPTRADTGQNTGHDPQTPDPNAPLQPTLPARNGDGSIDIRL